MQLPYIEHSLWGWGAELCTFTPHHPGGCIYAHLTDGKTGFAELSNLSKVTQQGLAADPHWVPQLQGPSLMGGHPREAILQSTLPGGVQGPASASP